MSAKYKPHFLITPQIANTLMRIEAVRQSIADLPVTPSLLKTLRETARLVATRCSTLIEGNLLSQEEVNLVIQTNAHFMRAT